MLRRRIFQLLIFVAVCVTLRSHIAFATYSVVILEDNGFIIGADSREIGIDGVNDEVCKVMLINNNIVFSLTGNRSYITIENKELDVLQIVANVIYRGETLEEYMEKISDRLVKWLNSNNIVAAESQKTALVLVGNSRNGEPLMLIQDVIIKAGSKSFYKAELYKLMNIGTLYPTGYEIETKQILSKYNIIKRLNSIDADRIEKDISIINELISMFIDDKISKTIGGNPTILRVEFGKNYTWVKRAKSCAL